MMVGAILADAPEAEITSIGQVAADIGLAFQIQDDILDVTGDAKVLGKPVGSDEKNEKSTYVTLEGLERAAEDVERFSKEASDILQRLDRDDTFLQEMIQYLIHRNK
jgi:geranylgeranyl diphosphate synthase type II